jgi:hypothetical protein
MKVMPFAWQQYTELGKLLQITAIEQKDIIDFFPTPQMKLAYEKRYAEDTQYLSIQNEPGSWNNFFNYDFGYGTITPCYLVNLPALLPAYRRLLLSGNNLLEEKFDSTQLQIQSDKVKYKDITAQRIIFCDGITSFQQSLVHQPAFCPQ